MVYQRLSTVTALTVAIIVEVTLLSACSGLLQIPQTATRLQPSNEAAVYYCRDWIRVRPTDLYQPTSVMLYFRRGRGAYLHDVSVCYLCDTSWFSPLNPDDGGRKYLRNVGKLLSDYTTQQPRRQPSSYSPPWEPEISQINPVHKFIHALFLLEQF
jgi:hypothetical protein